MAMDFWEAQRRARSRTKLYVTIFVLLTLIVAVLVEVAMRSYAGKSYNPPFPILGFLFILVTFCVAGFNYVMYGGQGGSYVAEALGGYPVMQDTRDPRERQLLNIVEEMAVASSQPMPAVYILNENGINAFAAGLTADKAAIAVTRGALRALNRDELQGVIGHEFGHIYNGDMKISLRLAAMVMGFYIIIIIGLRLMQFSNLSDSRDENKKGNPVLVAALILLVAGALTWLFGTLLKCVVSREREYLADACAVQFTRNPDGIANALRKIGGMEVNPMPKSGMAYSHLYLDDRGGFSALFATHPPLEKRIAAIEGRTYIPEEWQKDLPPPEQESK